MAETSALGLTRDTALTHTQVRDEAVALAAAAGGVVRVAQLPGAGAPQAALAAAAAAPPDVLVATPARVAQALRENLFRHGSISRGLQLLGACQTAHELTPSTMLVC